MHLGWLTDYSQVDMVYLLFLCRMSDGDRVVADNVCALARSSKSCSEDSLLCRLCYWNYVLSGITTWGYMCTFILVRNR
jgi:hypothetical protein